MGLRQYPLIAPEGWPFIAAAGLGCVLGLRMNSLLMVGASATLALLLLLLFRDPPRKLPSISQLNRRIARATETVCGSYASKDNVEQDAVTECRSKVHSSIEPQLAKALKADEARLARK